MGQYDKFTKNYFKLRQDMFRKGSNKEFYVMLELLGNIKNKKILDLGCGFGDYAKVYSKKRAKVTGIDASQNMIDFAKSQNIPNTKFLVGNLEEKWPFDEKFDIITSSLVLGHIKNKKFFFKECSRLLKKGGIVVFSMGNPLFHQEKNLIGKIKIFGKRKIFGNYFERRRVIRNWGKDMKVEFYHQPLEDYFRYFLENGFELLSFREPNTQKFIKNSWHSKNPTFLVFKLKKK